MRDIIITIPKKIKWSEYQKELDLVEDWSHVMNFKVPHLPTESGKGQRCYMVYDGKVVGWMKIVGFSEQTITCSTTGKVWIGKFIQRSGPFHKLETEVTMKGFQGFRYQTDV